MTQPELPSGTVTFLFTDLVESTALWEANPAEMQHAVARHDQLTQATVADHGGVIVKSTGDGAMAAFQDAGEAVSAAIALQRKMVTEAFAVPLSVRMGLHTGQATPRDRDYFAPAVNRAARIAGAAHGGQVLLSESTAALIDRVGTIGLGEHRLRGLPPLPLHQLVAEGLPREFPPLQTAASTGTSLPWPSTSLVGRTADVEEVIALLDGHRLVTLIGPGGAGKTRLALEVGHEVADQYPHGSVFADLAAIAEDAEVAPAVARALGLAADVTDDPIERVRAYLAGRTVLCILDNCEHLLDATAALADTVMSAPGPARLLATSREPIGVRGEQVYGVASLEIETEAVRLFEDRAREATASVVLDDTNRAAVVELCRRLDGIPLAIELAAARARHLAPGQLVDRLDDRFRLLSGGRRRIPRHQTLAATLDWSYQLLTSAEQQLLRRLSVAPASFPLELVEAVNGPDDPLGVLAGLVDKSLVQVVDEREGELRYRLLETVRLYAADKLAATGEAAAMHVAHRDHIRDRLEALPLEARWFGDRDVFAVERPGVRAALQLAFDDGDVVLLAELATAFDWTRSADWHDGLRWCAAAAEHLGSLPDDLRARVLFMRGMLTTFGLQSAGIRLAMDAAEAAGAQPGPLSAVAHAWAGLTGSVPAAATRDPAKIERCVHLADEGVRLSEGASDPWRIYCGLVAGLVGTALVNVRPDLREPTEEHLADALSVAPALEGYEGLRSALREYLGLHWVLGGEPTRALQLVRETAPGQAFSPMFGPSQVVVEILALGFLGQLEEARRALRAADDNARRVDLAFGRESVAICAGALAAATQDWESASRLLAVGGPGLRRSPESSHVYYWARSQVRAALGPERGRAVRDEGMAAGLDRVLATALA